MGKIKQRLEDEYLESLTHSCLGCSPHRIDEDEFADWQSFPEPNEMLRNHFDDPVELKDTTNKPADARHCYLTDMAYLTDDVAAEDAFNALNMLVGAGIGTRDFGEMLVELRASLELLTDDLDAMYMGVIKLRSEAIKSGKYTIDGYKKLKCPELLLDAIARHLIRFTFVSRIDEESGCSHLSHIIANLAMLHNIHVRIRDED